MGLISGSGGALQPGSGRLRQTAVRRLRFGTTAEVHAAVSMPTAPSSNSAPDANGAAVAGGAVLPGRVPGRAVLEVPGWQDSRPARAAAPHLAHPVRSRLRLFSGTSNPALAGEVASYLGMDLGKIKIKRFADGEIYVQLGESIRGADVFLVQPTSPPVNDHFMELAVMIDACRRASARSITAVVPYYGYARADRKTQGRESIAAKLTANLITEA
ncbi:ribose-phosphate pyrophosphokinase, partial [Monoraphidium neglectum]